MGPVRRFGIALAASLLTLVALQSVALAADGDEYWSDQFSVAGFNDVVNTTIQDADGLVYAAGDFTHVDGIEVNHIAVWDGATWSPLGEGLGSDVYALAFDSNGDLVAGGSFVTAGGETARFVASWDGSEWAQVGGGVNGFVFALSLDANGDLIVGGGLRGAGAIQTDNVIKWDGTEWSALGEGLDDVVYELDLDGSGTLVAGGSFTGGVASFGDDAWTLIGGGIADTRINEIDVDVDGNLYAGGRNSSFGETSLMKWDGATWTSIGTFNSDIRDLEIDADGNVIAVGFFSRVEDEFIAYIASFDGEGWAALSPDRPSTGVLSADLLTDGSLTFGGYFTSVAGTQAHRIATWDGTAWSAMQNRAGLGLAESVSSIVVGNDGDAYVGGAFTVIDGADMNYVSRWDGTQWNPVGDGFNSGVNDLFMTSDGTLLAVGFFNRSGTTSLSGVAAWDGTAWTKLGSTVSSRSVRAITADDDGAVYIGGSDYSGDLPRGFVAKLEADVWVDQGAGLDDDVRQVEVATDGTVYASGLFTESDGVAVNRVAQLIEGSWQPMGEGSARPVYSLTLDANGNPIAGGEFVEDEWIGMWDGTKWNSLPGGPNSWVMDLSMAPDGSIMASGLFYGLGDGATATPAGAVAKWDNGLWSTLGSGINGRADAIAADASGSVFVGGRFGKAGDIASTNFAVWAMEPDVEPFDGTIAEATSIDELIQASDYDPDTHGDLLRLYRAFFDREPDIDGAKYWIDVNAQDQTLDQIADYFTLSEEFANNYEGTSNTEYLEAVYVNVLGREYDQDGFDYWLGFLEREELTRGGVVRWIAANQEFISRFPYLPG